MPALNRHLAVGESDQALSLLAASHSAKLPEKAVAISRKPHQQANPAKHELMAQILHLVV
jgi:hypothetical protein